MAKDNDTITRFFKKNAIIACGFLVSTIALIIALLFVNSFINYRSSAINNALWKQTALTQTITKDVNRVYELNLKNEKNNSVELDNIKSAIKKSETNYDKQCSKMEKGYIVTDSGTLHMKYIIKALMPLVNSNYSVWTGYKRNIDIILEENGNSAKAIEATNYINNNNEKFYSSNKKIIIGAEKYIEFLKNVAMIILIIAITIFLLITILYAYSLYKNLYKPLNEFVERIGEIDNGGINSAESLFRDKKNMPMYTEVRVIFEKISGLYHLTENLNKNLPFKDFLNYVFKSFSGIIPYNCMGVGLLDSQGKYIKICYTAMGKEEEDFNKKVMGYEFSIEGTTVEQLFDTGEIGIVNDIEEHIKEKPSSGSYNRVLMQEGIKSYITYPLINSGMPVGIIVFLSKLKNAYTKEHIKTIKIIAGVLLVSLEEDIFINDMVISSTMALASLAEERDTDTGEHLERMQKYSKLIAEAMSKGKRYLGIMDVEYVDNIEKFSPLHDIGKVAIKDEILLKPGKLTTEEFEAMKGHTLYGGRVLRLAEKNIEKRGRSIFNMGIEIAEFHHEKWDGTGYPYGKTKEDIPLSARIVALADVFDALTSKRPYKEPFSFEKAVSIIKEEKGKQFDPYIVDVFLDNIENIKYAYLEFQKNSIENLS